MQKIKLTLLSPLHIGTGKELVDGVDFFTKNGVCYFINIRKLTNELRLKNCINKYIEYMKKPSTGELLKLFEDNSIQLNKVVESYSSTMRVYAQKIQSFIRNPLGEPYIPGAAIKGAIRTALLWKMLKNLDSSKFEAKVVSKIKNILDSGMRPQSKRKILGSFLVSDFLQSYVPTGGKREPHTDILRALRVRDVVPANSDSLSIVLVKLVSKDGEKNWHFSQRKDRQGRPIGEIQVYLECMMKGEFETELTVNSEILTDLCKQSKTPLIFENEKNVIEICQEFTDEIIEKEEKSYWNSLDKVDSVRNFYNNNKPTLRIGWGSGLSETTVISLLAKPIREQIAKLFRGTYPLIFPKTRRVLVENGNPTFPLGWVKLE